MGSKRGAGRSSGRHVTYVDNLELNTGKKNMSSDEAELKCRIRTVTLV